MRLFTARFTLPNGHRGELPVVARSACDAVLTLLDLFGDLRRCSVRPA
jgi:hypothetical protein